MNAVVDDFKARIRPFIKKILFCLPSSSEIEGVIFCYTTQEAKSFKALYNLTETVPNLVVPEGLD